MIRLHVPGFTSGAGGPRWGDAQIMDDGKRYLVIDGYCGQGTTILMATLKARKIKTPYLFITHPHYDHYYSIRQIIRDSYFTPQKLFVPDPESYKDVSGEVRSNKSALYNIISEAKSKGIPVSYLRNEQSLMIGEIKMTVYQDTVVGYDGNSEGYVNDRSLAFWFPELLYFAPGDAGMWAVEKYNLRPKWVKGGHHGNRMDGATLKPSQMAPRMKKNGCLYYWDNDYSTRLTDFLMTGREDAINAGMTIFNIHGDINAVFFKSKAVIYKDFKKSVYKCSYTGATALKGANANVTRAVLRGSYGTSNARITKLINAGYYPIAVQDKVTAVISTAKGIKSGKLDYGKNEARIAKIDKELGKGYGQLVQDYINVLCGVRKAV